MAFFPPTTISLIAEEICGKRGKRFNRDQACGFDRAFDQGSFSWDIEAFNRV